MLNATSTRDINQAARAASTFLQGLGVELTHAKALDLVARTLGYPHHMAAQAAVPAQAPKAVEALAVAWTPPSELVEAVRSLVFSAVTPQGERDKTLVAKEALEALYQVTNRLVEASVDVADTARRLANEFRDDVACKDFEAWGNEALPLFDLMAGTAATATSQSAGVPVAVVDDLCRILSHPDIDKALYDEGISDAAYSALADAAKYVSPSILADMSPDALRQAYDDLPASVSPEEFIKGHGNWSLSESEHALASRLAKALAAGPKVAAVPQVSNLDVSIQRATTQLELAYGSSSVKKVEAAIRKHGVRKALQLLNVRFDLALALGSHLIASDEEQGFWCNSFGWTSRRMAASGFSPTDAAHALNSGTFPADVRLVPFDEAQDYTDDDSSN